MFSIIVFRSDVIKYLHSSIYTACLDPNLGLVLDPDSYYSPYCSYTHYAYT